MNRLELVAAVIEKTGMDKKTAESAVNATVASIKEAMIAGDKVQLLGFGTFEVRDRPARMGRDPHTGASMEIAACKVPAFKAGKTLKDAVNGK